MNYGKQISKKWIMVRKCGVHDHFDSIELHGLLRIYYSNAVKNPTVDCTLNFKISRIPSF